jgi:hypothetical protein
MLFTRQRGQCRSLRFYEKRRGSGSLTVFAGFSIAVARVTQHVVSGPRVLSCPFGRRRCVSGAPANPERFLSSLDVPRTSHRRRSMFRRSNFCRARPPSIPRGDPPPAFRGRQTNHRLCEHWSVHTNRTFENAFLYSALRSPRGCRRP